MTGGGLAERFIDALGMTTCGRSVVGVGEGFDQGGELEDFDLLGTVGPIVAPANNYVTTGERVSVVAEIPALKFKFDVHALPPLGTDLPLGFAVRECGLNGFDDVAEFFGDHAKEKDDALFVDRFMAQAAEVDGVAIGWPIL
jgi:hypothetical protein